MEFLCVASPSGSSSSTALFGAHDTSGAGAATTTAADEWIDASMISSAVQEFYRPETDAIRRQALNTLLTDFKTDYSVRATLHCCMALLDVQQQPAQVQFFGALTLYETVRERWEAIIGGADGGDTPADGLLTDLRSFLVAALSTTADGQAQSVTNKLSAALALLALYTMNDPSAAWEEPVAELTTLWSGQPELLLRWLAELAAEFGNVRGTPQQRARIKAALERTATDVIRILDVILANNATGGASSLRNATVECVEQWLALPGNRLYDWMTLLGTVLTAVLDDTTALTSLLNVLAAHDDLQKLETLALNLATYTSTVIVQMLMAHIEQTAAEGPDADWQETSSFASAVCSLAQRVVSVVVRNGRPDSVRALCAAMRHLTAIPGRCGRDECVSDAALPFWSALRDAVPAYADEGQAAARLRAEFGEEMGQALRAVLAKLIWPTAEEMAKDWDREQTERFKRYRRDASEMALETHMLLGDRVLDYLNDELDAATANADWARAEAASTLWAPVADYLTQSARGQAMRFVTITARIDATRNAPDTARLVANAAHVIQGFAHILCEDENDERCAAMRLAAFLASSDRTALDAVFGALVQILSHRPASVSPVADSLLTRLHAIYEDGARASAHRLSALRCIGYLLGCGGGGQNQERVVAALRQLLAAPTTTTASNEGGSSNDNGVLFQLSVLDVLFASLAAKDRKTNDASVLLLLLRECLPLIERLRDEHLDNSKGSAAVVAEKICEALRSALGSLDGRLDEFLDPFLRTLDAYIGRHPEPAVRTAKLLLMTECATEEGWTRLCSAAARWLTAVNQAIEEGGHEVELETYGQLAEQLLRKQWRKLRTTGEGRPASEIATAVLRIAVKVLATSQEPPTVRVWTQSLAHLATNTRSLDDSNMRHLLAGAGQEVVAALYRRLRVELLRPTVDSIADALLFYAADFAQDTRTLLAAETAAFPSEAALIGPLFQSTGQPRTFRQTCARINLVARARNDGR